MYVGKAEKHKKCGRKPEKGKKNMRKTGKEKCARNHKMTFLSHGKLENFKISAEVGKLCLKTAENWKTPNRK